ncbi:MAG TPA: sigma-70 family RNA polymerase sigma factor [Gemmataceae bacterium]|jgi:RNA polymerase sigma-70 factor (ECF subfamily)|nr:sigma-70 family RNA polymerase sigma factor [Gemmataceae bacterium]
MVSDSSPGQEMGSPNVGNVHPPAGREGGASDKASKTATLAELFARHKDRLRRMVRLRLDRRLQGRTDPGEVVQEAYAEMCRRVDELGAMLSRPGAGDLHEKNLQGRESMPPCDAFLWMRKITGERLQAIHQEFFGATVDVAGQDVSLFRGALPEANSVSLAAQLLGRLGDLPPAAQEAERAEKQLRLQEALNGMNPLDREILALRHFEELSNPEAAEVLHMAPAESSKLFIHALKRLKDIVSSMPGFLKSS